MQTFQSSSALLVIVLLVVCCYSHFLSAFPTSKTSATTLYLIEDDLTLRPIDMSRIVQIPVKTNSKRAFQTFKPFHGGVLLKHQQQPLRTLTNMNHKRSQPPVEDETYSNLEPFMMEIVRA